MRPTGQPSRWLACWRIHNPSSAPLDLLAAWMPHDHFHCPEQAFAPALRVPPRGSADLVLPAACSDPPGAQIENAFLILRAAWNARPWRLFARLRVRISAGGCPEVEVERASVQPVGFASGAGSSRPR